MLDIGDNVRRLSQHDRHARVRQGKDQLTRTGFQLGNIVARRFEQRERFLFQTALGQRDAYRAASRRRLRTCRALQALRDALHVDTETARGQVTAKLGAQRVIPATREDGCARAADVAAKHDAGIIVHLVHQPEVDHNAAAIARLVQRLIQPPQIGDRAQHTYIPGQRFDLAQHLDAAEQLRHRAQRLGSRTLAVGCERIAQRRKGLVFNQTADAFSRSFVHTQFLDERLVNLRVPQFDAEIFRPRRGQRTERRGQDILVCRKAVCADQLRANLQKLSLVAVAARD